MKDIEKDKKKIKKIIEILKRDSFLEDFDKYISVHGRDTLVRYEKGEIIAKILEEEWGEQKYDICFGLAEVIFHELNEQGRGYGNHFDIPLIYKEFQEFMYEGTLFSDFQIPWEEWEDLAKTKLDILKVFLEDGVLGDEKKQDEYPLYQEFSKKFLERYYELEKKGYEFIF